MRSRQTYTLPNGRTTKSRQEASKAGAYEVRTVRQSKDSELLALLWADTK